LWSLPGSRTSGVGAERRELPACFAAVFYEILIVWRSAWRRRLSASEATDSASLDPHHQEISFFTGFMIAS
jgi:hypothetical protein